MVGAVRQEAKWERKTRQFGERLTEGLVAFMVIGSLLAVSVGVGAWVLAAIRELMGR